MKSILILLEVGILLILSLIHFYWVFGGKWGIESAIPEIFKESYFNEKNKRRVMLATLIVALGLIVLAFIVASNYFDFTHFFKQEWSILGTRFIGVIFLLRAIGDFNLVGLFKKKSNTPFARSDSRLFVPLCLLIGSIALLITFL